MWCTPPVNDPAYAAQMEEVLEVYKRPYDAEYPVVAMDEQHKQLISEMRPPTPMSAGHPQKIDCEYLREGTCVLWMFFEPLGGWRDVRVSATRTNCDWAHQMKQLVDHPRFAGAKRITVICDNLNTHRKATLYQAFPAAEALRIAKKLELVYTPRHGSWLNISESELSVLTRQCLKRRMAWEGEVAQEVRHWVDQRNQTHRRANWQFTTERARVKLKRLYPTFETSTAC
jgi:hypothetical protein